jgi:hypothetical protein
LKCPWGEMDSSDGKETAKHRDFPESALQVEEHCFLLSLKEDVPLVMARLRGVGPGKQSVAPATLDRTQHRIIPVRGFVAEVNAGDQTMEESA